MDNKEIIDALTELEVDNDDIKKIIDFINKGEIEKAKTKLAKYRHTILNDLHLEQNKLYCLDYISNELEKKFRR